MDPSIKTPNEGRPYRKEFHGRDDEGADSNHSFVTARCNFKNDLMRL